MKRFANPSDWALRTPAAILVSCALFLVGALSLSGCDFLEVDNPNNLVEEDLNDPAAAEPMANGAEAAVTRAMIDIIGPYSVVGDEVTWTGSRNAWETLNSGSIEDPLNVYTNRVYEFVAEARWTTDEYIRRLEEFRSNGALTSNRPLIRVYLYGAIMRIAIADNYDNFVFSDRQEAGSPIGEENMAQLYDTAVEYVNNALDLSPDDNLRAALLGLRARAKYSKGVWQKVNPTGEVNTSEPLVNSSEAAADAAAALDAMGPDYRYQLILDPSLNLVPFDQALADHMNVRRELSFTSGIGERRENPESGEQPFNVTLQDPIDEVPQPFLVERINEFVEADEFADHTVVSAREMHLIQAEVALAQGDPNGDFATHINALRSLDGLSEYTGQIPKLEMLKHARRVYLILQKRRLADMYRFGVSSPEWGSGTGAQTPGTFFPIPQVERQSNPNL